MRIVFMGTPAFAIPSLERLLGSSHQVVCVVTKPDRPRGRGGKVTRTTVKEMAQAAGVPVLSPEKLDEGLRASLGEFAPEVIVTAAYGLILPPWFLDLAIPLNVHASLLPAYRGAAPIQRAIMAGERETGITIMYMARGIDTGDILAQGSLVIEPMENAGELTGRLAALGADLLLRALDLLGGGRAPRVPQSPQGVSYARPLGREEEIISWEISAEAVVNLVRAFAPKPGARTVEPGGKLLKVLEAVRLPGLGGGHPGELVSGEGLVVATKSGLVRLNRVQPAGGVVMDDTAYLRGNPLPLGSRLGGEGSNASA